MGTPADRAIFSHANPRAGRTSDLGVESCRKPFSATLPKILKSPTQFGTTQGNDGVCALYGPAHSSSFEPGSDDHFAAGLEDAGGGTQTLGTKLRVAHAGAIADDVQRAFSCF